MNILKISIWIFLGGLLIYLILSILQVATMAYAPKSITDTASTDTFAIIPEKQGIVSKVDSIAYALSSDRSRLTQTKFTYDSLTFGYAYGAGLSNKVMSVLSMQSCSSFKKFPRPMSRTFLELPWLTLKRVKNIDAYMINFPLESYCFYVKDTICYLFRKQYKKKGNIQPSNNKLLEKVGFFVGTNNKQLSHSITYEDLSINIPLDNKAAKWWLTKLNVFYTFFSLLCILFVIVKTGTLLLAISKNKAFDWQNVMRLKQCICTIAVLLILPYLLMFGLFLGYYKVLHGYVDVKSWNEMIDLKVWVILIVYLSIFLAFFRGYKIQSEQEFII